MRPQNLTLSKALVQKMGHARRYGVGIDKTNHAIAFVPNAKNGFKLQPSNFAIPARVSRAIPCGRYLFKREEKGMFTCVLEQELAPSPALQ